MSPLPLFSLFHLLACWMSLDPQCPRALTPYGIDLLFSSILWVMMLGFLALVVWVCFPPTITPPTPSSPSNPPGTTAPLSPTPSSADHAPAATRSLQQQRHFMAQAQKILDNQEGLFSRFSAVSGMLQGLVQRVEAMESAPVPSPDLGPLEQRLSALELLEQRLSALESVPDHSCPLPDLSPLEQRLGILEEALALSHTRESAALKTISQYLSLHLNVQNSLGQARARVEGEDALGQLAATLDIAGQELRLHHSQLTALQNQMLALQRGSGPGNMMGQGRGFYHR